MIVMRRGRLGGDGGAVGFRDREYGYVAGFPVLEGVGYV